MPPPPRPGQAFNARAFQAQERFREASALHQAGRLDEALVAYEAVLKKTPDHAEALHLLGFVYYQKGDPKRALALIDKAIKLSPRNAAFHYNRAVVLQEQERAGDAVAGFDRALTLTPGDAEAWSRRAQALMDLGQPAAALDSCDRSLNLRPASPDTLIVRGNALRALRRLDEALAAYAAALAQRPGDADAQFNRAVTLQDLKRLDEAVAAYDSALAARPGDARIAVNKASALLLAGHFARGWPLFERRWDLDAMHQSAQRFPGPPWRGATPLQGKTLLLYCELGLGDAIQFCRYATLATAQGARVILEAPAALAPLLRSLDGVAEVVEAGVLLPPFDLHSSLLSLPLALGTTLETIPAPAAYLHADPAKVEAWTQRLGPKTRPRIGLAWSGNPQHRNDPNRSIPLPQFAAHLPPGFDYVCLQNEVRDGDRPAMETFGIRFLGEALADFSDTAALCALMDRVISVDTSVAHLAAALGKPTAALLPFIGLDWRWLLNRPDSPWYPSMTLHRQGADSNWAPVLEQVAGMLEATTKPF